VPFPNSKGYGDPNMDEQGFNVRKVKKGESFLLPMSIRAIDLEKQQKYFQSAVRLLVVPVLFLCSLPYPLQ